MKLVSLLCNPLRHPRTALLAGCVSLSLTAVVSGAAAGATAGVLPGKRVVSATLEQCVTAPEQAERSATFAGEMNAIPGTAHMEMRIDVLERMEGAITYHTVSAPGLGVWRSSAPGVKVYRYLKQVTNLAGPAFYRASVRFRWLGEKGRLLAATELRTRRCEEPEGTPPPPSVTPPTGTATPGA